MSLACYDADGRSIRKDMGTYSTGEPVHTLELGYGAPPEGGGSGAARETVFRTVRVNGLTYSYYYDALGRRRAKVYPSGVRDEFFHSASHELLVDQGSSNVLWTSFRPVDDFVWLGGRPVVLLRGKLDAALDVRLPDSSLDCRRNGEAAACGAWFPVTDHIGKPVLMLDSAGRVAGAADDVPFGHVNRVTHCRRRVRTPAIDRRVHMPDSGCRHRALIVRGSRNPCLSSLRALLYWPQPTRLQPTCEVG